jgi:hypothetical protein
MSVKADPAVSDLQSTEASSSLTGHRLIRATGTEIATISFHFQEMSEDEGEARRQASATESLWHYKPTAKASIRGHESSGPYSASRSLC